MHEYHLMSHAWKRFLYFLVLNFVPILFAPSHVEQHEKYVWHDIFAGSKFRGFRQRAAKIRSRNKLLRKTKSAKIYSIYLDY